MVKTDFYGEKSEVRDLWSSTKIYATVESEDCHSYTYWGLTEPKDDFQLVRYNEVSKNSTETRMYMQFIMSEYEHVG